MPEAFWYISLLYRAPGPPPVQVEFKWDRHRLYDRETVAVLHQLCLEAPGAVVASVQGSRKTRWAPNPLSTLEMQKRASQVRGREGLSVASALWLRVDIPATRTGGSCCVSTPARSPCRPTRPSPAALQYLRIPGERIMKLAEELYQAGYVSYPRTETDMFDPGYDLKAMVQTQADSGAPWAAFAQRLNTTPLFRWPKPGAGRATGEGEGESLRMCCSQAGPRPAERRLAESDARLCSLPARPPSCPQAATTTRRTRPSTPPRRLRGTGTARRCGSTSSSRDTSSRERAALQS